MRTFKSHEEIKEAYESGKYNIFFDSETTRYVVSNIGSTILCKDETKNCGMGTITNFPVEYFFAIEKPEPVVEMVEDEDSDSDFE